MADHGMQIQRSMCLMAVQINSDAHYGDVCHHQQGYDFKHYQYLPAAKTDGKSQAALKVRIYILKGATMEKVVILGGGTAGWLTALLVKRAYADCEVTVIESEEIGILGAGEGTVPDFVQVLQYLQIPVEDIIKHCDGTLKLGIQFENWNGDGKSYFHEFAAPVENDFNYWHALYDTISQSQDIGDLQLGYQLAKQNLSPVLIDNWRGHISTVCPFALHFNARRLAKFLREVAEKRDIQRVEGRMTSVISAENGDIQSLRLDGDRDLSGDFFFDCSGFARLLIGQHYGVKWISYRDHLPMDTALPFFLPHDNDVAPQTTATAMSSGWVWKTPVRDRYGCGYVFDSRYITEEQALRELEQAIQQPIDSPKTFRFNAGGFEHSLVNNCMAVGLSQSFIEPLEATSIWVACLNLNTFLVNNLLNLRTPRAVELFNNKARERNQTVVDFLYQHYLTKRQDSTFWREFREVNKPVQSVLDLIEHWRDYGIVARQALMSPPPHGSTAFDLFHVISWLQVSAGLGHLEPAAFERLKHSFDDTGQTKIIAQHIRHTTSQALSHQALLQRLRGN